MADGQTVLLLIDDRAVLSSLQFALAIEGFQTIDGAADEFHPSVAAALVLDQTFRGDWLFALASLRASGCAAPVIVLATNPDNTLRTRASAQGAQLIEKPLLSDDLSRALRAALTARKAA